MTLATTLISPLLLKWAYRREGRERALDPAPQLGAATGLSASALAQSADV